MMNTPATSPHNRGRTNRQIGREDGLTSFNDRSLFARPGIIAQGQTHGGRIEAEFLVNAEGRELARLGRAADRLRIAIQGLGQLLGAGRLLAAQPISAADTTPSIAATAADASTAE